MIDSMKNTENVKSDNIDLPQFKPNENQTSDQGNSMIEKQFIDFDQMKNDS